MDELIYEFVTLHRVAAGTVRGIRDRASSLRPQPRGRGTIYSTPDTARSATVAEMSLRRTLHPGQHTLHSSKRASDSCKRLGAAGQRLPDSNRAFEASITAIRGIDGAGWRPRSCDRHAARCKHRAKLAGRSSPASPDRSLASEHAPSRQEPHPGSPLWKLSFTTTDSSHEAQEKAGRPGQLPRMPSPLGARHGLDPPSSWAGSRGPGQKERE